MSILYNTLLDALPAATLELITTVAECNIDIASRYRQLVQFSYPVHCDRTQEIRHRFFHMAFAGLLPTFQSVNVRLIFASQYACCET